MNYDFGFRELIGCTVKDRQECLALIRRIVELTEIAKREGLLALEDKLVDEDWPFLLKTGVQLVVDGTYPGIVRTIVERFIIVGDYRGKELLARCIMLEGVLAIQQGDIPRIVNEKLMAFLGEDFYEQDRSETEREWEEGFEGFIEGMRGKPPVSEIPLKLGQELVVMEDRSIQKILRKVDSHPLARFLACSSGDVKAKIYRNMSKNAVMHLEEDIRYTGDCLEAQARKAQTILQSIITKLREAGEIS